MCEISSAATYWAWTLLLATIAICVLSAERAFALRREKVIPPSLLDRAIGAYRIFGINEAMLETLSRDSPLGRVLAAGLRRHAMPALAIREAIDLERRVVVHELGRGPVIRGLVVATSALLGLFGAFIEPIRIVGPLSPRSLESVCSIGGIADAISIACIGLFLAATALIWFFQLRRALEGLSLEMERHGARLVDAVCSGRAS